MAQRQHHRITGGKVVTPGGVIDPGEVLVRGQTLAAVKPAGKTSRSSGEKVIAADGCWVVAGFLDLHLHGGGGAEVMDASRDSLIRLSRFHAEHGTTAFLATVMSASYPELAEIISSVDGARRQGTGGSRILGVHLEGPYLNPDFVGAHKTDCLRLPDREEMGRLLDVAPGCVKMVTLAPELPGASEVIELLIERGIVVAAGHSAATYPEAKLAHELGLRHVVHLFNAMPSLHHRQPGLAGFALAENRLSFELIADGLHLHPAMVRLALAPDRMHRAVLVTDSMAACGMGDGLYSLGGRRVVVQQGRACLDSDRHRLAGSLLTMDRALANVQEWTEYSLEQALPLVSENPSRVLGAGGGFGSLVLGKRADLVVLDAHRKVCLTMEGGEIVFCRQDFSAAVT